MLKEEQTSRENDDDFVIPSNCHLLDDLCQ